MCWGICVSMHSAAEQEWDTQDAGIPEQAKVCGCYRARENEKDRREGWRRFLQSSQKCGFDVNSSIIPAHVLWLRFLGQCSKYQTGGKRSAHGRGTEERRNQAGQAAGLNSYGEIKIGQESFKM